MKTYTVKKGDTLYGISNQFGVSVTELARINNVNANTLQIGQVLTIPSESGTNPNNMFMYTVKKGDSLYSIANKYNTTVKAIVDLNYLSNTNLSIGQIIRIPETYTKEDEMTLPSYKNYVVKKGDTIYSIVRNNNINVDTLIRDNSLNNNNLTVGQTLKIRLPIEEEVEECFGKDYIEEVVNNPIYVVKKGDSLYSIANKYNTSISTLQKLNNLKNINLSIGQVLKLPINNDSTYVVKSGDNLYSIARRFNTTVDNIKRKNNLNSNLLSIGQTLII